MAIDLTPEQRQVGQENYARVSDGLSRRKFLKGVAAAGGAAAVVTPAAYFGYPSRKLQVVGVTGTDGKTTTSTLIYYILRAAGRNAGLISTIRAEIAGRRSWYFHRRLWPCPVVLRVFS